MQVITKKRAISIGLRARAPLVVRAAALLVLVAAVVFVAVSYYKLRNTERFQMKSETPVLSTEIKASSKGTSNV